MLRRWSTERDSRSPWSRYTWEKEIEREREREREREHVLYVYVRRLACWGDCVWRETPDVVGARMLYIHTCVCVCVCVCVCIDDLHDEEMMMERHCTCVCVWVCVWVCVCVCVRVPLSQEHYIFNIYSIQSMFNMYWIYSRPANLCPHATTYLARPHADCRDDATYESACYYTHSAYATLLQAVYIRVIYYYKHSTYASAYFYKHSTYAFAYYYKHSTYASAY
jgi:hypothetical protein